MAEEAKPEAAAPATTEDGRVRVQAPDGSYGSIAPDKLEAALQHGYKPEGAQEFAARKYEETAGLGGAAKAFGENALSTGTLGLSDVAAGAIGGNEYRQNRSLRELAYPTASTAGEVAGMVLPALIPGGAEAEAARGAATAGELAEGGSLLGRAAGAAGAAVRYSPAGIALKGGELAGELVGRGLEHLGVGGESLLGRVATTGLKAAAGGAVEGAAFGAGGALSEAALAPDGDYDSIAQKLWAGGIEGAEFGASVGGALGVGGELAGAAARKIGGTFSAQRALRELSDSKTLKSAGYQGSDIAKVTRDNPARAHQLAEALRGEESIGWADTLSDRATKLEAARKEAGDTLGEMRKALDEQKAPGQGVRVREALDEAKVRAEELKTTARTAAQDKVAKKFAREIDRMQEAFPEGQPATFEAAHEFRRTLDDELTNYGRRTYPASGAKRPPDPFEKQLIALRHDIESRFEAGADEVMGATTPEFKQQYQDAKTRYGALKEITAVSKKRVGSLAGNRDVSLTDTIAGAAGFATMGPAGILAAAANRALRSTQADHVVGKLASDLAKFDEHVTRSVGRWGSQSRKAAKGVSSVAEAPPTGHARSAAKRAVEKGQEITKGGISSTLHVRSGAVEQHEQHQHHVGEYFEKLHAVESEANSPPGTLVHIPNAPKTQEAAEAVRRKQASWLLSQAPVPPAQIKNPVLARIARQTPPNIVESLKWLRKVKTIEDPKSAMKALEEGRLTTDHVAALEQMPAVLASFRRAAIAEVTDKNADLSYSSRIQLGVLLGVTTDPSLRPESIAAGQAVYEKRRAATQQQAQRPQQSIPGKAPGGMNSTTDTLESNAGRI